MDLTYNIILPINFKMNYLTKFNINIDKNLLNKRHIDIVNGIYNNHTQYILIEYLDDTKKIYKLKVSEFHLDCNFCDYIAFDANLRDLVVSEINVLSHGYTDEELIQNMVYKLGE